MLSSVPEDFAIGTDDPEAEYEAYLASLETLPPDAQTLNLSPSEADLAQILPAFVSSLASSDCHCPFCDSDFLQIGPNNTFGCTSCGVEIQIQFPALSFAAHIQPTK